MGFRLSGLKLGFVWAESPKPITGRRHILRWLASVFGSPFELSGNKKTP